MSFHDSTYDQIEAYLNGEMSSEERNAFDTQIANDQVLASQVEKHRLANALIIEQRLFQVKNILHEEQAKNSNPTNYKLYVITALAVIGSAVGVTLYTYTDTQKTGEPTAHVVHTTPSVTPEVTVHKNNAEENAASQMQQTISGTSIHKQDIQVYEQTMREGHYVAQSPVDSVVSVKSLETKKIENPAVVKPTAVKDVCADVAIKADIKTMATCLHEASGNVVAYNIQGGIKPYSIFITDAHKEFVSNGQLAAGSYQIHIEDANACLKIYSDIQITEKECAMDYAFNPFTGEKWQVDAYQATGLLQLYNKGGMLYYQTTIDAHSTFEWTGTGSSNQIQPGYYIFVIKYADGTVKKGSVTIVQ